MRIIWSPEEEAEIEAMKKKVQGDMEEKMNKRADKMRARRKRLQKIREDRYGK